jgi:HTH-type transcriptional regulator / antitoxin HigA
MRDVHYLEAESIYPHLGHSLRDLLEENNMSQRELAARAAVSTSYINSIVMGNRPISTGFAYKMEKIFSLSAERIMQEQVLRELKILRLDELGEPMNRDLTILPKIMPLVPILLGKDRQIAEINTNDLIVLLRRLFKVSSLENLPELYQVRAYPEPPSKRANLYLLAAWALHCEGLVHLGDSEVPFDREKIYADRYELQGKIRQCDNFSEISSLLKTYGVNLLFYFPFEGSIVNGFVKLTAKGSMALVISNREKDGESIIPALLHLLGHVMNGDVRGSFIDFKTSKSPADKKADRW